MISQVMERDYADEAAARTLGMIDETLDAVVRARGLEVQDSAVVHAGSGLAHQIHSLCPPAGAHQP